MTETAVRWDTQDALAPVRGEQVRYRGPNGRVSPRLGDVLPDQAAVSRVGLAALFANPAQDLQYYPRSVWQDVTLLREVTPWRSGTNRRRLDLLPAFDEAIAVAMGDADVVAVSVSGGLDSLLIAQRVGVRARREGRRCVAIVADLIDDLGASCAAVVERQLRHFDVAADLVVVPEDPGADLRGGWSPLGPRADALPAINRRIGDIAAELGSNRILVGSGADEQLQVTAFLGPLLVRARRFGALWHYARDLGQYSGATGYLRDAAAARSHRLPLDRSFAMLMSLLFPAFHRPVPDGILAPGLAAKVAAVTAEWIEQERRNFAAHDYSWFDFAAFHAVWPRPMIPPAGAVGVCTPFLEPDFSAVAQAIPVDLRYDESFSCAYHRMKSLVVGMFPAERRAALPRRKQTFGRALARAAERQARRGFELGIASGLLDPRAATVLHADSGLQLTAVAVEEWLHGARERGFRVGIDD